MRYDKPKETLETVKDHLQKNLDVYESFSIKCKVDSDWKQWRLVVDKCVPDEETITLCYITVGLTDLRLASYIWDGRNRNFPIDEYGLLEQMTQHIKFCLASS